MAKADGNAFDGFIGRTGNTVNNNPGQDYGGGQSIL